MDNRRGAEVAEERGVSFLTGDKEERGVGPLWFFLIDGWAGKF